MFVPAAQEVIPLGPDTAPVNQETLVKTPGDYIEMNCVITSGSGKRKRCVLIGCALQF